MLTRTRVAANFLRRGTQANYESSLAACQPDETCPDEIVYNHSECLPLPRYWPA